MPVHILIICLVFCFLADTFLMTRVEFKKSKDIVVATGLNLATIARVHFCKVKAPFKNNTGEKKKKIK